MTMTGLRVFDETIHTSHTWLHELEGRLSLQDRQQAYRLMRAGLHTLRDALEVQEVAHLSAQLPMLLRGIYFEGWRPKTTSEHTATLEAFLTAVSQALPPRSHLDAETAMREIIGVLRLHVSEGEMAQIRRSLPNALQHLWDTD